MKETFGAVLKRLMTEKGITNAALARSVGCDRTTIGDYTRDKYLPKEETFHRIHQVIPDKELYDAFFEATKPKDRKNKPLINNQAGAYNFYTAKNDEGDIAGFIERLIHASTERAANPKTTKLENNEELTAEDKKYIAHALLYITTLMEEEGSMAIAPTDYAKYKKLYSKFSQYVDESAFL